MGPIQSGINQLFGDIRKMAIAGKYFYDQSPTGIKRSEIKNLKKEIESLSKTEESLAQKELGFAENLDIATDKEQAELLNAISKGRQDIFSKELEKRKELMLTDPSDKNVLDYYTSTGRVERRNEAYEKERERLATQYNSEAPIPEEQFSSKYINRGFGIINPAGKSGNQFTFDQLQKKINNMRMFEGMKQRVKDRGIIPSSINRKIKETYFDQNKEG